jgi:hypothetical protein
VLRSIPNEDQSKSVWPAFLGVSSSSGGTRATSCNNDRFCNLTGRSPVFGEVHAYYDVASKSADRSGSVMARMLGRVIGGLSGIFGAALILAAVFLYVWFWFCADIEHPSGDPLFHFMPLWFMQPGMLGQFVVFLACTVMGSAGWALFRYGARRYD